MNYRVTMQIDGDDLTCGTLFQNVRHGVETTTFSYDVDYLLNPKAFSLSPDLPLGAGTFHSTGLKSLRAFEDAMPDRWGRNLLLRSSACAGRPLEWCRQARPSGLPLLVQAALARLSSVTVNNPEVPA